MRRAWQWLRPLLAVAILVALAWRLGTAAFLDGLRAIDVPLVFAAIGVGLLTTVGSAWRWCVVARGLGMELQLDRAIVAYYRCELLNAVLPAGVLGDLDRAVDHGRQSGQLGRGLRAVVFERFAGQVVLVAVAIIVLLVSPWPAVLPDLDGGLLAAVAALTVAGGLAVMRVSPLVRRMARLWWVDAKAGLVSRYGLPRVSAASMIVLLGHMTMFVLAARAAGVTVPVAQLMPLIVAALLVMAVPVNIGGWGPREAFLAVAFGAAGLGAELGVTTGVVYGVLALIAVAPGLVVLTRRRRPAEYLKVLPESVDQRGEQGLALAGRTA